MTTRTRQVVLTGALASFALLTFAASPSLAESRTQTVTPTTTSNTTNEANQTQQQIGQRTAPANQTPQQPNQTGCSCCKDMMNNKQMMHNMHQMKDGQNNQSR